jgi:hypothetical protein
VVGGHSVNSGRGDDVLGDMGRKQVETMKHPTMSVPMVYPDNCTDLSISNPIM